MRQHLLWTTLVIIVTAALLAGCGPEQPTAPIEPAATAEPATPEQAEAAALEGKLVIFHAGSLTVPIDELAEAFQAEHPDVTFETEAAGSNATARKISELGREADLMMSADYTVIDQLLIPDFAAWNVRFARNTMVIAYTDQSTYADEITADNWTEVLTRDGVIYGHSDPDADPCGYRTLMVFQLAEKHYGVDGLAATLDAHCPPENVRPKSVELIALLESGDMDYAFEYRSVAVQHGLQFVELPDEINLSMVEYAGFYGQAAVEIAGKEPGTTMTMTGKPIVYGVTIPENAPSPELAIAFAKFLLGPRGQAIMEAQGQPPIVPPVTGNLSSVPTGLQDLVVEASTPGADEDAATDTAALVVSGAVENVLSLTRANLESMGAEEVTVEHPKKGVQTYKGVRLSAVLEAAGPTDAASTLALEAADALPASLQPLARQAP